MHLKSVIRSLGLLMLLICIAMSLSLAIAAYEHYTAPTFMTKAAFFGFVYGLLFGVVISGGFLLFAHGATGRIEIKEALLLVTTSWLWGGFISALPFYFFALHLPEYIRGGFEFINFVNCFFEGVSGLTATGASILADIDRLPSSILFWRGNIQWLGGLGIVVLFVAILPFIASGNTKIYKAEATGIPCDPGTANIGDMARSLWIIYLGMTMLNMLLLKIGDSNLTWISALTIAFSSTSTAGFSIFSQSAGSFTLFNQWVCIIFMFLGGVNYALYIGLTHGKIKGFLTDAEFKTYVYILFFATVLIAINIYGHPYKNMAGQPADNGLFATITNATFQAVSIQTTTGFSNVDSDGFPAFSKIILCLLMFVGGCGGSTSGGIKVIRILSAFRLVLLDVERVYRPHIVRPVVVGKKILDAATKQGVLAYVLLVLISCFLGTFLLAALEPSVDLVTLSVASIATFNNIGPGFGLIGASQNYNFFSDPAKILLSIFMIIGRLEFLTVLALLMPRFWRRF